MSITTISNKYLSKVLSFDEINNIFQFLDLKSLVAFTQTNKHVRTCGHVNLVWYHALLQYLPEYPPFSTSQSGALLSSCALEKLQTFVTHRFSIAMVTNRLQTFAPRFLHRSMTSSYNGETYVFGGVNCRDRGFSDCWKVIVDESTYTIRLCKIDTTIISHHNPSNHLHDHPPTAVRNHPGNTSASATCVMHDGSPVVFSGIVDGMFSSQFWRLQLHQETHQGTWINCRLSDATRDDDTPWLANMMVGAAAVEEEEEDEHAHGFHNLYAIHHPNPVHHPPPQNISTSNNSVQQHIQQQIAAFFFGTAGVTHALPGQGPGLGQDVDPDVGFNEVVNEQPLMNNHCYCKRQHPKFLISGPFLSLQDFILPTSHPINTFHHINPHLSIKHHPHLLCHPLCHPLCHLPSHPPSHLHQ